ncbi:TetR/AcrR family transcriptional regulator [Paenibacillus beijingensis]|nr:TetR/AcrR family transcriptional regulator [Paenibacillus beijingensis]
MDRKIEIIKAAAKSFALFGYKATTMDQVARIAKVGKGTIYTFFENKEQLFDEIIRNFTEELLQVAEAAIRKNDPFADNLYRCLLDVMEFRSKHDLIVQLSHEAREIGTESVVKAMRHTEEALLLFVKDKVQEAVEAGELKRCDPEVTAYVLIKLFIALVVEWPSHREPLSKEHIMELFGLYFMNGVSAK